MNGEKEAFCRELELSTIDGSFIKLSLGKPRQSDGLQKLVFTPVVVQSQSKIKIVESFSTQDKTKVLTPTEAVRLADEVVGVELRSGHLFTTECDLSLQSNRRGEMRLHRTKPTLQSPTSTSHNRTKNYLVADDRPFLQLLGLSDGQGRIKPTMAAKFKQIQRFVELIDGLFDEGNLSTQPNPKIVDIGSGKGYLTFALYDYLRNVRELAIEVTGIERRTDLVDFCNATTRALSFEGLSFQAEQAAKASIQKSDIVIALHACDTATDDAIHLGIAGQATLIVCAPCCQHELAPQLKPTEPGLMGMIEQGLFRQRQADLVTDSARSLLMEVCGYRVKVIEFVGSEHTNKNVMLAAVRSKQTDRAKAFREYLSLKKLFGFDRFKLERLLEDKLKEIRTEP